MREYRAEPAEPALTHRGRAMVAEWVADTRTRVVLHDVKPAVAEVIAGLLTATYHAGVSDAKLMDAFKGEAALNGVPESEATTTDLEEAIEEEATSSVR